tara:strand:- start:12 stop:386 length:375 start_codon:yes stop_codon:yes gene_type:complete
VLATLSALIGPVSSILEKAIPDRDLREKLSHELVVLADKQMTAQIEVNKVEAAHPSLFVSGWRPMCGWVCISALAYSTIISPVLGIWISVPEVDVSLLTTVLMGMLGLGAMRSYEKTKGVSRER